MSQVVDMVFSQRRSFQDVIAQATSHERCVVNVCGLIAADREERREKEIWREGLL